MVVINNEQNCEEYDQHFWVYGGRGVERHVGEQLGHRMGAKTPDPRSVSEIRQAIALFEAWEVSINDLEAAKGFTEAVQILDDFLECEPDTPHRTFIRNLKVTNTRRLLQQLAKVDKRDLSLWLEYALSAVAVVGDEAKSLMDSDAELKADFASFQKLWGSAVTNALHHIQSKDQK
jgi:hypothetical protein